MSDTIRIYNHGCMTAEELGLYVEGGEVSSLNYLAYFVDVVGRLRATNSRTEKENILKKEWESNEANGRFFEKLLHAVYDYDKQYYVTSANIVKFRDTNKDYQLVVKEHSIKFDSEYLLWDLLRNLSNRVITGYSALTDVNEFLRQQCAKDAERQIVLDIIDKDLKCGLSVATINKVIPNLIPQFKVALAQKLDKEVLDETYVCSRKLDGCRCVAICKNKNDITFYSRQGKEFTTLNVLKKDIQKLFELGVIYDNTVLDGEVCIVDKEGKEDFQSIMKEIKRKDHTIQNPMYIMFDILTLTEFNNGNSRFPYKNRISLLDQISDTIILIHPDIKPTHLRVVEHFDYTPEEFKQWQQRVINEGWEGLIARKNVSYEGKRSANMLKIKSFTDEEFKVIGVEEGDAQELINGVMVKIKCIGALTIEYKGNKVGVGTGLSLEQRKRWYKHPEEIIGKTITVKYFSETIDQNGKPSLRFPVLKAIYENGRDL